MINRRQQAARYEIIMTLQNCNIGPFILDKKLGEGATGEVWLAHAKEHYVAIKLLRSQLFTDSWALESFERELRATSKLYHPNIAALHDYGDLGSISVHPNIVNQFGKIAPFLILEHIDGDSLGRFRGRLQWPEICDIIRMLLLALGHAHARNIIHRDLKPSNIMISQHQGGTHACKLVDFGLALHMMIQSNELTEVVGTPAYMAPEQWQHEHRKQGPWTDLYSFGCVIWTMLTGEPPFGRGKTHILRDSHLYQPLPALQSDMAIPNGLEQWLTCLLAKEIVGRYPRAMDALHAFNQLDHQTLIKPRLSKPHSFNKQDDSTIKLSTLKISSRSRSSSTHSLSSKEITAVPEAPTTKPIPKRTFGQWGVNLLDVRGLPCIGRQEERHLLWKEAQKCSTQGSRATFIRGISGVGSTRLAQWLCETLDEEGIGNIFALTLVDQHADPLATLLREHFKLQGLTKTQIYCQLRTLIQPFHLLEEQWQQAARWLSGMDQKVFSSPLEKYYLAVDILLAASASFVGTRKIAVLFVDDAQRQPITIRFCRWVLENEQSVNWPILFVFTCSDALDNHVQNSIKQMISSEKAIRIALQPLRTAEQRELVQRMLKLHPALTERVLEKTRGNPKVAREIIREWTRRRILTITHDGYQLPADFELRIPGSIADIWRERIQETLTSASIEERKALEIAGCLGQQVSFQEWEAALQKAQLATPRQLLRNLFRLRFANLEQESWTFRHPAIIEELQLTAQKSARWQHWNQLCAEVLEELGDLRSLDRIGRHLIQAGSQHEGLLARMKYINRNGDNLDAEEIEIRFRTIRLGIENQNVPDNHILWQQYYFLEETRHFMQGNREALDKTQDWLHENLTDKHLRVRVLQHRCYVLSLRGHGKEEIKQLSKEGLALVKELDNLMLEEIFLRVCFDITDSNIRQWHTTLQKAQVLLDTAPDLQPMAYWFWARGWSKYWTYQGDLDQAKHYLETSLELSRKNNRSSHISLTLTDLSELYLVQGNYQKSYELAKRAHKLIVRLHPRMMNEANLCMGLALFHLGNTEEGLQLIRQVGSSSNSFSLAGIQTMACVKTLAIAAAEQNWTEVEDKLQYIEENFTVLNWWERHFGQTLLDLHALFLKIERPAEARRCKRIFYQWWDGNMSFQGLPQAATPE